MQILRMPKFPMSVRSGAVVVKIYRTQRKDGRVIYQVGWVSDGGRRLEQFGDLASAKSAAQDRAADLSMGRRDRALTVDERDEFVAAKELVGDRDLVAVAEQWAEARELVGADFMAACRAWAKRADVGAAGLTVNEAAKQFIAAKEAEGVNTHTSYGRTFPHFLGVFGALRIGAIGPGEISEWLATFEHPGSRNSHRKRVKSFFRWCRRRAILPLDVMTAAERTDPVRGAKTDIGLVTPEQLHATLARVREVMPVYVPNLAVLAWAGLRRAEVHGQRWEDIDLDRAILRVSAAKPNTPARRLVPLPECAVEVLRESGERVGAMCENLAVDRIRDIGRTAGIELAKNGFRHSWISARVALTGNVPEVALEAGNTPKIIHAHYRELMPKEVARAWFTGR